MSNLLTKLVELLTELLVNKLLTGFAYPGDPGGPGGPEGPGTLAADDIRSQYKKKRKYFVLRSIPSLSLFELYNLSMKLIWDLCLFSIFTHIPDPCAVGGPGGPAGPGGPREPGRPTPGGPGWPGEPTGP